MRTWVQEEERFTHWATIWGRVPFRTTGRACRKSPPKTMSLPPKGREQFQAVDQATYIIPWKERLIVSNKSRLIIEASYLTTSLVIRVSSACCLRTRFDTTHCVPVQLQWNSEAGVGRATAIKQQSCCSLEATANAMFPPRRTLANAALNTYVLPVPLGPSTKNSFAPVFVS